MSYADIGTGSVAIRDVISVVWRHIDRLKMPFVILGEGHAAQVYGYATLRRWSVEWFVTLYAEG